MSIRTQPVAGLCGLLTTLVLALPSVAAAAEGPEGYRSADFGMSYEAVMAELVEDDAVVNLSDVETEEGDRIVNAELQASDEPETDLRYVFPAGSQQLALVVAFYPHVEDLDTVTRQLEERFGEPWEEDMAQWWFEQLKGSMPQEPSSLTVWGGEGNEAETRGRFTRLWTFDDYLSVEYLDTRLFP
ncbi:hypothetical protein [Halomonas daqiaonensis]|uniref:Uncharacterized protein n=1 Tax=Halomonas daqiaonensis TaxID=650850 RepID=A0A1H7JI86_9GAMM|nr:hypothetical protein [Halomonas daqiaonensis]SEK74311.1 hypothetical protein SAMN04488129_10465 [Halomonas daqiaonensis]